MEGASEGLYKSLRPRLDISRCLLGARELKHPTESASVDWNSVQAADKVQNSEGLLNSSRCQ